MHAKSATGSSTSTGKPGPGDDQVSSLTYSESRGWVQLQPELMNMRAASRQEEIPQERFGVGPSNQVQERHVGKNTQKE